MGKESSRRRSRIFRILLDLQRSIYPQRVREDHAQYLPRRPSREFRSASGRAMDLVDILSLSMGSKLVSSSKRLVHARLIAQAHSTNPAVFKAIALEMLFLANVGIDIFRMDAVAFIWKRMGTTCESLPEAHKLLRAFNAICRIAAPSILFKVRCPSVRR